MKYTVNLADLDAGDLDMWNVKGPKRERKGIRYWFGCLYYGSERRMLTYRALSSITYKFAASPYEEQQDVAVQFYREQMVEKGFDLNQPELVDQIESMAWSAWGRQSGYFAQQEERRQAQLQYDRELAAYQQHRDQPLRGSTAHMRAEALKTYQRTGVWGLNSYGGHILNEQERRNLGL
jgi:hypothetical protein